MEASVRVAGDNVGRSVSHIRQNDLRTGRTLSAKENNGYEDPQIRGRQPRSLRRAPELASLATTPVAMNQADCPYGWYWDDYRQNCLPPGLPKDPPSGCLTGSGTHANGTICIN